MTLADSIRAAKQKLPLPELMSILGDAKYAKKSAPSPFRAGDNKGCFGIFQKEDGDFNFKDQVTGDFGDEIDYLIARLQMEKPEAQNYYLKMAGIERQETTSKFQQAMAGQSPRGPAFDWPSCVAEMAGHVAEVAEWRGYSPDFLEAFRVSGGIGWHDDKVAFPVHNEAGAVIGCHYRLEDGRWMFTPGCKAAPIVIGSPSAAKEIVFLESQWDALALADRLEWHTWPDDSQMAIVATRGAANGRLVGPHARGDAKLFMAPQNDKPDLKGKIAAEEWEKAVIEAVNGYPLHRLPIPAGHKDLNDWTKDGVSAVDLWEALERARRVRKSTLTIRTVGELLNMDFDDSDNLFGDRVMAAGQPITLLGPGGIGKSRIVLQKALCMITGRPFLEMPTYGEGKKWLIIQSENSNRRLQNDLKGMLIHMRFSPAEIDLINQCLFIHTIERDEDSFLDLGDKDAMQQIAGLVEDYGPDIVVFDPLNTFTAGDLNSDQDMRAVAVAITKLVKRGGPHRVPFIIHHSLTGKSGAARAVGWDKASYGRNSKVLQAWTRAQINIAPQDPDDSNVLVMSCGKNNNGKVFADVGILFNEEKGIYQINPAFSSESFREAVGIDKAAVKKPSISPDEVAGLFDDSCDRKTLATRLKLLKGCSQATAYRAIEEAEKAGFITRKRGDNWNPTYQKPEAQTAFESV